MSADGDMKVYKDYADVIPSSAAFTFFVSRRFWAGWQGEECEQN